MIHFGDVTKIKGNEVPAVDVITYGAPCQDLSVAGKRKGMKHSEHGDEETTRSGLFFEAIRIIKEMRDESGKLQMQGSDDNKRMAPRFTIYENVYGAFSSNNGEDWRAVLEETAKIVDKDAHIPGPPRGGWPHAGFILGDGYSLAWRGHNASEWGVPQRRKRICLLADFGGDAAGRILFESELWRTTDEGEPLEAVADNTEECRPQIQSYSESVSRDTEPSNEKGEGTPTDTQGSIGEAIAFEPGIMSRVGGHFYNGIAGTVRARAGDNQQAVCYGISPYESNSMKSPNPNSGIYETETARTLDLNGGTPACNQGGMAIVFANKRANHKPLGETCETIEAHYGTGGNNTPLVAEPYTSTKASYHQRFTNDGVAETLVATDYKDPPTVFEGWVVRRLTPTECLRLQGYPDGWYDIGDWVDSKGKKHKDSDTPKYKAAGNSIALPFWEWLAGRIAKELGGKVRMASLFDGIGGFPLVFQRVGGEPVWASEIEEFGIEVTKRRFPEK